MDKTNELKEKLANGYIKHNASSRNKIDFIQGFDAAMELQLPVKFAEWLRTAEWQDGHKIDFKHGRYKKLYDYFILNIYQPEQK